MKGKRRGAGVFILSDPEKKEEETNIDVEITGDEIKALEPETDEVPEPESDEAYEAEANEALEPEVDDLPDPDADEAFDESADEAMQEIEDMYNTYNPGSESYVSYKDRYEDVKSSATTFILVGGIGLVIMLVLILDVFSLPFTTTAFFNFIMTAVFVIFIIVGIASEIMAASLKKKIAGEETAEMSIEQWLSENITAEKIDDGLDFGLSDEEKYFERMDAMKQIVTGSGLFDADDDFLENVLEKFYEEIFEGLTPEKTEEEPEDSEESEETEETEESEEEIF